MWHFVQKIWQSVYSNDLRCLYCGLEIQRSPPGRGSGIQSMTENLRQSQASHISKKNLCPDIIHF